MKTEENKASEEVTQQGAGPACEEAATDTSANASNNAATLDPTEEWKNRAVYLMAEIENMRKRFTREKSDVIRFAGEETIKAMLPILDNLQLAVKAVKDADAKRPDDAPQAEANPLFGKLLQGIDMTVKHFEQTLERMGVQFIPSVGQIFDPEKHEALAQAESNDHKESEITAEMQRGYLLHGRVLRPARVVVNKRKG